MSKLRYGVQLYGNIRLSNEDPANKLLGNIQIAQNKYARFLNGTNLLDKIPTEDIFKELQIPSVNQVNAQIKLLDVWKSQHSKTYPTKWASRNDIINDRRTRASNENALFFFFFRKLFHRTFFYIIEI